MSTPNDLFQRSAQLFKAGQREESEKLLIEYLKQIPSDPRGWWAMANITDKASVKRKSLEQVLKLRPDHSKATEMLKEMDEDLAFLDEEEPSSASFYAAAMPAPNYDDNLVSSPAYGAKNGTGGFLEKYGQSAPPPASEETQMPWDDGAPAKSSRRSSSSDSQLELIIGLGLILTAVVATIGLAWYAYSYLHMGLFGLFGPDLNEVVEANTYSIRTPEDWSSYVDGENDAIVLTSMQMDIEQFYYNSEIINEDDIEYDSLDEIYIIGIAPVNYGSDNDLALSQAEIDLTVGLLESMSGFSGIEIETEKEDIDIDGNDGKLTSLYLSQQSDFFSLEDMAIGLGNGMPDSEDLYVALYFATTKYEGQEYSFYCITYEKDKGSNRTMVRRLLNSIEFK